MELLCILSLCGKAGNPRGDAARQGYLARKDLPLINPVFLNGVAYCNAISYSFYMKAVILAAGRGTRLRPLTDTCPKPLLSLREKPILEHILEQLPKEVTEVIIVVDHLKEQIRLFLSKNSPSLKVHLVEQANGQKGTLAALRSTTSFFEKGERFLVLNGDDLVSRKNLEKMLDYQRAFGVHFTNTMPRYHKVMSRNGFLDGLVAQSEEEQITGVDIATGAYLLDTDIFHFEARLLAGNEIGIPQTILDHKESYPVPIVAFDFWVSINSIQDLQDAQDIIIPRK